MNLEMQVAPAAGSVPGIADVAKHGAGWNASSLLEAGTPAVEMCIEQRIAWWSDGETAIMSAMGSPAQTIRKRALSYPHVSEEFPWGESAFKVKGKTFVFMRDADDDVSISVKLPHSADFALTLPGSERTHYGLGAKGWVTLRPTRKTKLDILFKLIDESYRAVAPKRVVRELDLTKR